MKIQARSLLSLEWDRLVKELSSLAQTETAQARLLDLLPLQGDELSTANVQALLDESDEAKALISARAEPSLHGLTTPATTLEHLAIGSTLGGGDLMQIERLLRISRLTRSSLNLLDKDSFPALSPYGQILISNANLERELTLALDPDGTVKDSASALLSRLRQDVRNLSDRVKEELRSLIHHLSGTKALQDELYTMRNGRFVLPVDSSQRYQVQGVVHDASQSGLTVYVEPISVMELSNQIRIKESEIETEIERILKELSDNLQPHADSLKASLAKLFDLDEILSRGRLAHLMEGEKPELTDYPVIDLKNARHPLLLLQKLREGAGKEDVIANDVQLGPAKKGVCLVITGPNTGGKTVLIKLIGLTALMLRAGLLPPVARGSRMGIFSPISADIGDDQSIVESLSTFSSHIKNIVEITNSAGPASLVLLDEIGAGTDPKEGAALSQAILENLSEAGAFVVATTHLGELKTLAYMKEGFINASFEFDQGKLNPTYRLQLGVPGSSRATQVASRLGLGQSMLERARELMQGSKSGIDEVVEKLTLRLEEVERQENALKEKESRLEQEKDKLKVSKEELARLKVSIIAEEKERLQEEYKTAAELIRETVAGLQKEPSLKKAETARRELEALKKDLKWDKPLVKAQNKVSDLAVGQRVKHLILGRPGQVLEVFMNDKGVIEGALVQVGTLKVKAKPQELEVIAGQNQQTNQQQNQAQRQKQRQQQAHKYERPVETQAAERMSVFVRSQANTLDLRGKRVDEAMGLIDTFVDGCVLSRISPFMIIHGHGTGAIKAVVRDYLRGVNYSIEYRAGEHYEGGDGVTVIELTD